MVAAKAVQFGVGKQGYRNKAIFFRAFTSQISHELFLAYPHLLTVFAKVVKRIAERNLYSFKNW